ncbi:hypothetical protein LY474_09075 [Myxococcus stipitatus]|uniref:DUF6891 domain-containing protein n=1 Tax=Myxococcus stipitatus TaxID=83455 RepID=UPI001F439843|nr:hypothetical protein [Myxococcus stipitatus]MCE9667961.1 hypothetical protein [Myxococcus stipitatus]
MDWLKTEVEVIVKSGLGCEGEVLVKVRELAMAHSSSESRQQALVDLAWQQLRDLDRFEFHWDSPTTNDAIDRAFEELRGVGVLALQGIGSPVSSGWPEVQAAAKRHAGPVRGATFYHGDDLESAVLRSKGLHLVFGTLECEGVGEGEAALAIAREVREVLSRHGVETEWDGSAEQHITIPPFSWTRRRRNEPIRDWMVGGMLQGLVSLDQVERDVAIAAMSRAIVERARVHYGEEFLLEALFDEATSRANLYQVVKVLEDGAEKGVANAAGVSTVRAAGLEAEAGDELLFQIFLREDEASMAQSHQAMYSGFLPLFDKPPLPPLSARDLRERTLRFVPVVLAERGLPAPEGETSA